MKLKLIEEDTRPMLYSFQNVETGEDVGEAFFMGDIIGRLTWAEAFGIEVINKDEYI